MANLDEPTIIIKKIKKVAGGHHGGAWKVAYADFVTAMMAFFLLLWLLSSAPQEVLRGIAEYFAPTIGLKDQKGIGFDGGSTPKLKGNKESQNVSSGILFSAPSSGSVIRLPKEGEDEDDTKFLSAEQTLKKEISEDKVLKEFANQILIEQTPEGLQVQIRDSKNRPMFEPGTAKLAPYMEDILTKIAKFIKYIPNFVSITGYTTGTTSNNGSKFDAWRLSIDRANNARIFLEKSGVDPEQIGRVVGKADRELANPENPAAPENIRIAILLLKNITTSYKENLLSAPQANPTKDVVR